ncbi:hypothetical protein HPB49_001701 [Dermacentor silvarum]|uniref:Uncharacterized protein n=1 Tax=Dermacentor silvarum TaxID=543639 RepID=A0ACB8C6T2_DERSI|nr:hypothetical protein HPB49_001701 [Dermacentor silvarum]
MPGLAPPPVDLVHRLQQHAPQLRAEMRPELRPELHREIRAPSRRPATALMAALQMHMAEPPKEPDADERPKEDYVPVHVTYPKSPAHFYVRLLEERKSFKALSSRLQSACDGGRETKDDWEVGQWCAAMGSSYHWMRAKVVEVEEEELHVFFVDSGMQVVMPKAEVVVLPAALAQPPPFARVCHLANMIPAGGSKSWSKTAEECFAEQLSRGNKTFMVQLGEELDDSLPVDVMVEEVIEAGALEPMRKEYRSVREALKEMGYGFISKKSSSKTESAAESAEATRSSIVKTTGDREAAPSSSKVQTASDREAAPSSKVDAMGDRETASSSKVKIVSDAEITPSREVKTTGDGSPDALKEPVVSKNVTENSASSQSEEPGPARADSAPDKVSHPEEVVSAAPSVRFVDYGTSEYVSPDGIFTDLMFEDVPILCLEVEFYGLKPVTDLIPCPYKTLEFPEDGVFPVIVTNLDDADLGCIQLAKFAHPSNDEQEAINCSIDAFSAMAEALQKEAEDCPLLLDTSLGTACIGKYGYDKLWYRGIVTGVKKKKVTVFYVDYGNSESILKEE